MAELSNLGVPGASVSGSAGTQPTSDASTVEQLKKLGGLAGMAQSGVDGNLDTLRTAAGGAQDTADTGLLDRIKANPGKALLQAGAIGVAGASGGLPLALLAALGITGVNQDQQAKEQKGANDLMEQVSASVDKRRQFLASIITSGQGNLLLNPDGTFPEGTSAELLGTMLGLGIPINPGTAFAMKQTGADVKAATDLLSKMLPHVKGQAGRLELFSAVNKILPSRMQFSPGQIERLSAAGETPLKYNEFIEIYPTAEGVQAAVFADLNGLDYSDSRVLELAGPPVGKQPRVPASDKFKQVAWASYQKIQQAIREDPELLMLSAADIATRFIDSSTLAILEDEIPGFKKEDSEIDVAELVGGVLQLTIFADAVRRAKDPDAPSLINAETLSEMAIKAVNTYKAALGVEAGNQTLDRFEARVSRVSEENPGLTLEEATAKAFQERLNQ